MSKVAALPRPRIPLVTMLTALFVIGMMAYTQSPLLPDPPRAAALLRVFSGAQVWDHRGFLLLLAPFAHVDLLHALSCLAGFWMLAPIVERALGHQFTFGLVFFGALVGSGIQLATGAWPALGLSPVAFAMAGAILGSWRAIPLFHLTLRGDLPRYVGMWLAAFTGAGALYLLVPHFMPWPIGLVGQAAALLLGAASGRVFLERRRIWLWGPLLCTLGVATVMTALWAPWLPEYALARFQRLYAEKQYVAALAELERPLRREVADNAPATARLRHAHLLNAAAWVLATAAEDAARDGARAIELAERACALTEWLEPGILDTLAAAYAEAGRWDEAKSTQARAVAAMRALVEEYPMNKPGLDQLERNLASIEAKRPIRE